ncbi:CLC4F protein, partial [Atractosteus spatula]|nr:CLC4F protein [Atractosteus spatula]
MMQQSTEVGGGWRHEALRAAVLCSGMSAEPCCQERLPDVNHTFSASKSFHSNRKSWVLIFLGVVTCVFVVTVLTMGITLWKINMDCEEKVLVRLRESLCGSDKPEHTAVQCWCRRGILMALGVTVCVLVVTVIALGTVCKSHGHRCPPTSCVFVFDYAVLWKTSRDCEIRLREKNRQLERLGNETERNRTETQRYIEDLESVFCVDPSTGERNSGHGLPPTVIYFPFKKWDSVVTVGRIAACLTLSCATKSSEEIPRQTGGSSSSPGGSGRYKELQVSLNQQLSTWEPAALPPAVSSVRWGQECCTRRAGSCGGGHSELPPSPAGTGHRAPFISVISGQIRVLNGLVQTYDYWTGLSRKDRGAAWSWVTGGALNTAVVAVSESHSGGNCVAAFRGSDKVYLYSATCTQPYQWSPRECGRSERQGTVWAKGLEVIGHQPRSLSGGVASEPRCQELLGAPVLRTGKPHLTYCSWGSGPDQQQEMCLLGSGSHSVHLGGLVWRKSTERDCGLEELHLEMYRNETERYSREAQTYRLETEKYRKKLESVFCVDPFNNERKQQCCPQGWKGGDSGRCYYVSTDRRSWETANQFCSSVGAQLLVINDEREMMLEFEEQVTGGETVGLKDYSHSDDCAQSRCRSCVLITLGVKVCILLGTVIALGTVLWKTSTDWESKLEEQEGELARYRNETGRYRNESKRHESETERCRKKLETIFCVDPLTQERQQQCCPQGWKGGDSGRCYYVSTDRRSWETANQFCSSVGAKLLVINDEREMMSLRNLIQSYDSWIGLSRTEDGVWSWVDGRPLDRAMGSVSQDGVEYDRGKCAKGIRTSNRISFSAALCTKPYPWICEGESEEVWLPPQSAIRT